jgi:hypothetical protein
VASEKEEEEEEVESDDLYGFVCLNFFYIQKSSIRKHPFDTAKIPS